MYKSALKQHDNFVMFEHKMSRFIQRNHMFHLVSCCYKVFGKTSDTSYGNVGHSASDQNTADSHKSLFSPTYRRRDGRDAASQRHLVKIITVDAT